MDEETREKIAMLRRWREEWRALPEAERRLKPAHEQEAHEIIDVLVETVENADETKTEGSRRLSIRFSSADEARRFGGALERLRLWCEDHDRSISRQSSAHE